MKKKNQTGLIETACRECGIIVSLPLHLSGAQYRCPRCDGLIYRRGQPFSHVIVMAFTSILLFLPLTFLPILDLNVMGLQTKATLFEALWTVYKDGYYFIAFVALMTGLLVPVIMMTLLLLILLPLHFGHRSRHMALYYRLYAGMRDWGMAEVYLISIVVSMVKLQGMGTLHIGLGFYMFIFFFITFYIATVWFNPEDIWYDQ